MLLYVCHLLSSVVSTSYYGIVAIRGHFPMQWHADPCFALCATCALYCYLFDLLMSMRCSKSVAICYIFLCMSSSQGPDVIGLTSCYVNLCLIYEPGARRKQLLFNHIVTSSNHHIITSPCYQIITALWGAKQLCSTTALHSALLNKVSLVPKIAISFGTSL